MTLRAVLDPAGPCDDAFGDALAGVGAVWSRLGGLLDEAMSGEGGGALRDGALCAICDDAPRAISDDQHDDLVDAILGLASLRTTVDLMLAALVIEPPDMLDANDTLDEPTSPTCAPTWARELLR